MRTRCRYLLMLLVTWLVLAFAAPVTAKVYFQCPGYDPASDSDINGDGLLRADDGEISNPLYSNQVCLHLVAGDGFSTMADVADTSMYIFGFHNVTGLSDDQVMNTWDGGGGVLAANWPAPTLKFKQGDYVYLTLTNVGMMMRPDLFDPHTVHWHGFPNASAIFDGVPDNSISINMGSSLTYFYHAVEAGTFVYHCHVEATEHMQMGMLGNLYVTPSMGANYVYNDADTQFTLRRDYPIQIQAFDPRFHEQHISVQPLPFADMKDTFPMLNGRGYPDTINSGNIANELGYDAQDIPSLIEAVPGDTILIRFSSLSTTSFHTLATTGIPMKVVGKGARVFKGGGVPTGVNIFYQTTSVTLGGGETVDVLVDTTGIPEGTYFLYTTNLNHLSNDTEDYGGMMTEIRVQTGL
ncbi:multicopper oxidase [Geothermobacter ehrlichii]|uniref:Multicopper oxidase n=1 Tax=Geothermobacter ehrlichii TaxID=213224 RepID=A0A5D3WFM3_9BACT|nr:multicopper oxidase domain-containing protein [Geothermobacter ehrlichii]TYO96669.1 multicopper oxidase [Geothermobacter ehrlichii]